MRDELLELTQDEIDAGWHFCHCWDGLLIGDKMGELEHCYCIPEYQLEFDLETGVVIDGAFKGLVLAGCIAIGVACRLLLMDIQI